MEISQSEREKKVCMCVDPGHDIYRPEKTSKRPHPPPPGRDPGPPQRPVKIPGDGFLMTPQPPDLLMMLMVLTLSHF